MHIVIMHPGNYWIISWLSYFDCSYIRWVHLWKLLWYHEATCFNCDLLWLIRVRLRTFVQVQYTRNNYMKFQLQNKTKQRQNNYKQFPLKLNWWGLKIKVMFSLMDCLPNKESWNEGIHWFGDMIMILQELWNSISSLNQNIL